MKSVATFLATIVLLLLAAANAQSTSDGGLDHWTPPEEIDVNSPPSVTPAPTSSDGVIEEPTPSSGSLGIPTLIPVEESSEAPTTSSNNNSNTRGFGAGPSIAVALGGTVLIASTLFLGRRRLAAENADNNSQSLGQSADADTL